ncbi:ArsA family ATPase [Skermania sp. ID1734]|uniref:ArsA family ATPase n=1 Tax=Skermania sp. ID1734 TaxID=2597516 RepID=UPI00117F215A|nr:ArsA family ATPase [Skermania sp. ID1734]TSE01198.1 ArsA family ATPase [Skermania sp. ID1734]
MELFLGKGGVGKTTLACATALARARDGERVLVASIDQSHSLGDVLGLTLAHDPGTTATTYRVVDGLEAIEIDTLALLEERFRTLREPLKLNRGGHDHGFNWTAIDASELTGFPGAQEMLALAEITDLADDDEWDLIVVDCPATAATLQLLATPDMALGYLERVWPKHRRVAAAIGTDIAMAMTVGAIEKMVGAVTSVRDLLADRDRTSAMLVTSAERVALLEAARTRSTLALLGIRLNSVMVNKVLPDLGGPADLPPEQLHPAVRWHYNRHGEQRDVIAAFAATMPEVSIVTAQHTGPEPVGLSSLSALSYALDVHSEGNASAFEPPVEVQLESGSGLESVYAMRMHLPLVDPASLSLGRAEDDVIVGADGMRRRVRLASVLRRCVVAGAELDGQTLVVRFRPDPKVWPR